LISLFIYSCQILSYLTPLHYASGNGHLSVVEYLVNQKADINAKNKDGKTPMVLAFKNGKSNVIEFLESKGG